MKTVPFSLIQDSETDVFMQIISKHTLVLLKLKIFFGFLKNICLRLAACWAPDCELTNSRPRVQLMTDITNNVWCWLRWLASRRDHWGTTN